MHADCEVSDDVVQLNRIDSSQNQAAIDQCLQPAPQHQDAWPLDAVVSRAAAGLEDHGEHVQWHYRVLWHDCQTLEQRSDVVFVDPSDRFQACVDVGDCVRVFSGLFVFAMVLSCVFT